MAALKPSDSSGTGHVHVFGFSHASHSSSSSPNRPTISSSAVPLSPKRTHSNSPVASSSRHRKSRPDPLLPPSPSMPSFDCYTNTPSPAPSTPTRPGNNREPMRTPLPRRHLTNPPRALLLLHHKSPRSPRTRTPPPRIVTPRGFTSTSTSSLNYPPSYSPNAIRRSAVDRRSPSPSLPRAASPSTPSRPLSPSSTMTRQINASTSSLSLAGPSTAKRSPRPLRLMNKLRPGSIARVDLREDGKLRTSNVTKFLASCSANGLPPEDLFLRDDLIEGTSDCLARVAKTIITLVKWAETPVPTHSHLLRGGGSKLKPINVTLANAAPGLPYRTGSSSSRAVRSSPNLSAPHSGPSLSSHPPPHSPTRSTSKHRLPPGLPTVRSHSPDTASSSDVGTALGTDTEGRQMPTGTTSDRNEVPPILAPPRSPLCPRPSERDSLLALSWNEFVRMSIADSRTGQSIASSNMTDTSTYSSLLDAGIDLEFGGGRSGSGSGPYGKFGTIRIVTTEATSFIPSEWPSVTRTEGRAMAASMLGCDDGDVAASSSIYGNNSPNGHVGIVPGLRRSLEGPTRNGTSDLLRVVEESEELAPVASTDDRTGRMERINLSKGKWTNDFLDALKAPSSPSRPIAIRRPPLSSGDFAPADPFGLSAREIQCQFERSSPPRDSVDSLSLSSSFPSAGISHPLAAAAAAAAARRPTHRARHSVDAPVLAPKDLLRRDSSPDPSSLGLGPSPGRVTLRRISTRNGRSGTYVPRRSSPEDGGSSGAHPVPRAVSGESPSPFNTPSQFQKSQSREVVDPLERAGSTSSANSPSLIPRGRFQSEVDGSSSRRRPRPNSYDEFGAKPRRSRFESERERFDGAGCDGGKYVSADAGRKGKGKAPTHFQLGNSIGRGQFGAVYRALNLNTGQMVAVKRIGLEGLKEEEISQLMREVDLVKRLSHPSIVKYEGMARDENTLSIVLEYAENGSLGQILKVFGKLNEKLVASYVFKILEGLDYLHRSDVVHCDLKAANILTTKTGNVKLSDFGVSLNLRAMECEIKDVAGTPNWMAPEVIELTVKPHRPSRTSGRLDVGESESGDCSAVADGEDNARIVMFRIVEDGCPPIPERFSGPLVSFLKECFHKDPAMRPSAEQLFEHEWSKNHWGLNNDLRPPDSIPFLRRVSADLQKNGVVRHLMANLELDSPTPQYVLEGDMAMLSSLPGHRSFTGSASPVPPEAPQTDADLFEIREHTFVKTTFSKQGRRTMFTLQSDCALQVRRARAALTCDLRSKLLMHAQFAERGSSPAESFTRLPNHHPASASSSRGSLGRERTNSPQLSPTTSPPHPPVAYIVLSPFSKRSRASLTPDPTNSNSSVSLAPPPSKVTTSVIPEGNIIRRKLSIRKTITLTRQREPQQQANTHLIRERPQSISSIGSSCANLPQSQAS
ncbi:hypothetical protein V8E53_004043 [Lactarius tabidus]